MVGKGGMNFVSSEDDGIAQCVIHPESNHVSPLDARQGE